ncbi:MAG: FISUMP domain-containing protein [Bacteroidota bacterium]
MKQRTLFILILSLVYNISTNAQVAINSDGSSPNNNAILDIKSTNKGVLIPRMTNTQIELIPSPAAGLLVYSTDNSKVYCFHSGDYVWKELSIGAGVLYPSCGVISDSEGNSYNTVLIGSQCWMAENINIGTRVDGSIDQTNNGIIEKYCYDDNPSNCDTYGALYQWDEMMQYITTEGTQGICPAGWHVPTNAEMILLSDYLGGGSVAGGKMKEIGTSHWNSPNTGATNESGFYALPGGKRSDTNGAFLDFGNNGNWWSSTEGNSSIANRLFIYYNNAGLLYNYDSKLVGFSVRCLKD